MAASILLTTLLTILIVADFSDKETGYNNNKFEDIK